MRLKNETFYRRVVVGADPYNQYPAGRQTGIGKTATRMGKTAIANGGGGCYDIGIKI